MFQAAELGQKIADSEYKDRELQLWQALLAQQQRLRDDGQSPVLIDFAGVRGAGKSECTNILNKWMDARWITAHGFGPETEEETLHPVMWRYWMRLPPRGQMGIYLSGRYTPPLLDFVHGRIDQAQFQQQLDRINAFEKALADDGALILKFWMHIGRDVQKRRLESLQDDPNNYWRITETDWEHWKMYDRFIEVAEQIVAMTSTGHAPWEIVEGEDSNYRNLRVGAVLSRALDRHITRMEMRRKYQQALAEQLENGTQPIAAVTSQVKTVLDTLSMRATKPKNELKSRLEHYQERLGYLHFRARQERLTTILVFEGPDAGGKGGAIRRITNALDARTYKLHPFAAPTDEESAHHYLWRFWRCLPRDGRLTIFDRSWYGRVLVERVEGFASDEEWRRAYAEINEFENQMVDHGVVLLKFWIQITKNEQLRRFKAREAKPHKQWKQTEEDWRNRERWDDYQLAAHDMIQQTDTRASPWVLVPGNIKQRARVQVLKKLCKSLEKKLGE